MAVYTAIDNPELHFQNQIWAGNGSTNAITFDGSENMQPDMVWIKIRVGSNFGVIHDSVRGNTKRLLTGNDSAETTESSVASFDTDGFTLSGNDGFVNTNDDANTYCAWSWKAGTALSNSAGANGGSLATTGSINSAAGFGIVSYDGSGANATIYHGIGKIPRLIFAKNRDDSYHWSVYSFQSNTTILRLNDTNAPATESAFQSTNPTATIQSLGTHNQNNGDSGGSDAIISYMFCDVQGYQRIGEFTGNGNASGTMVHTGFKPAWVIIKETSAAGQDWFIVDNKRDAFNPVDELLYANAANAEVTSGSHPIDFLSNGFKCRGTGDGNNGSGKTYLFMAIAEAPFVNSKGVCNNAE